MKLPYVIDDQTHVLAAIQRSAPTGMHLSGIQSERGGCAEIVPEHRAGEAFGLARAAAPHGFRLPAKATPSGGSVYAKTTATSSAPISNRVPKRAEIFWMSPTRSGASGGLKNSGGPFPL